MERTAQNILVGGSGFIGSELALELARRGESVVSISRNGGVVIPGVKNIILDISEQRALEQKFPYGETVYILVGQNHSEFDAEAELEALRKLIAVLNVKRPKKVLYLSSVLVYGETDAPAGEETPCCPADQYSQFKCSAEALLRESLSPQIVLGILRLANVYGGKKNRGFIGLVMDRLAQEQSIELIVNGDGLQERDYMFIDDVVAALISVKHHLVENDIVNIATGQSYTLLDILDQVSRMTGRQFPYKNNGKGVVEIGKSRVKNEKLGQRYHFSPKYGLSTGLEETYLRSVVYQEKVSGRRMLFIGGEGFIGRNLTRYFTNENECISVGQRQSVFADRRDRYIKVDPYKNRVEGEYDVVVHLIDNKVSLSAFELQEEQLTKNFSLRSGGQLVVFSSAVVYVNPNSEYGKRKQLLEAFYKRYCKEYGITLTIFRPFNIFGPFQLPNRQGSLIANLMCNFLLDESTEINDMDARRDFMCVTDIAKFVECALARKQEGVFDIGSGTLVSIRELIDYLNHHIFFSKGKITDRQAKEQTNEQPAKRTLSPVLPMVDFDEGLKRTFAFYKNNLHLLKDYVKRKGN